MLYEVITELAMSTPNCKYTLGSVLNHVSLHQTVIGLEAEKQMEMAGEYPDIVIGCFGGGSNFSRITSYNVCYTKLLRQVFQFHRFLY